MHACVGREDNQVALSCTQGLFLSLWSVFRGHYAIPGMEYGLVALSSVLYFHLITTLIVYTVISGKEN